MTDFLSWWADHWPLAVVVWPGVYLAWYWMFDALKRWLKRRREP